MLILMALTGCKDPTGIWLFQLESGDIECTDTVTENYTDGSATDTTTTGDWTIVESESMSPSLVFGQIVKHSRNEGVLVIGDFVFPGTLEGGIWTFTWTGEETTSDSETHADGYTYTRDVLGTSTTTWTLTVSGDNAEGTGSTDTDETRSWTETDEWDTLEVGVDTSKVPSPNYLEDEDGFPVLNEPEESDCSSGRCELSAQSVCSGSAPFSAVWAGFLEEDAYNGVSRARQDPGT
ncbi:MAG TPA: hypothetical protein QGF58_15630 [Myxococcota bacterium]|nr:hypothetical protein [Myxococcota bacterium]